MDERIPRSELIFHEALYRLEVDAACSLDWPESL